VYTRCIYCSAALGRNEAVEDFPVGRTLAFDGEKGRLWAVCSRCGRWNLAPIEERWEAVEELEKRFRASRLRVQSENVGLAKAPDGTRLVRVGQALPGELAAWRYGRQMRSRRWKHLALGGVGTGALAVPWLGALVGLPVLGIFAATPLLFVNTVRTALDGSGERVLLRFSAGEAGGEGFTFREYHLRHTRLRLEPDGRSLGMEVWHPDARLSFQVRPTAPRTRRIHLADPSARRALRRLLVHSNRRGAVPAQLNAALGHLAGVDAPDEYLYRVASAGSALPLGRRSDGGYLPHLQPTEALALEMALHHEEERRAIEGELAMLEAAWRAAEEIAAIADALPDVPPPLPPGAPGA
jgi:hypothetical protein